MASDRVLPASTSPTTALRSERNFETRQAALLELNDRFRDLEDPAEIAFAAAEILGRSLNVTRAVVERRRVELELRESAERFRTVFENAAVGMIEIDADWRILGANAAYCETVGIPSDTLIEQSCLAFTHEDDIELSQSALRAAAAGPKGERISFEKRYIPLPS